MVSLFFKELRSFLSSLIGYLVIGVFLIITGLFLWVLPNDFNILSYGYANLDGLFILAPFVFLFLIPAISMRSFADEQKSGTDELLFTRPLSEIQIILAKSFCFIEFGISCLNSNSCLLFLSLPIGFSKGKCRQWWFLGIVFGTFIFGSYIYFNRCFRFLSLFKSVGGFCNCNSY